MILFFVYVPIISCVNLFSSCSSIGQLDMFCDSIFFVNYFVTNTHVLNSISDTFGSMLMHISPIITNLRSSSLHKRPSHIGGIKKCLSTYSIGKNRSMVARIVQRMLLTLCCIEADGVGSKRVG